MLFTITFGSGQLGGFGLYYHMTIEAPSELVARQVVNKMFDRAWSMIYLEGNDYAEKYGTRLLGHVIAENEYCYETRRTE